MNTNDQHFVSFVIPTRNEELNIRQCIQAINNLEYDKEQIEIIVVDGLSDDRTCDIAESLGARILTNKKILQSAARNLGAANAIGDLVAFIDADVLLEPSWLKLALNHFNDPELAAAGNFPGVSES